MVVLGLDTFGDINTDQSGRVLTHAEVIRDIVEEAMLADSLGVDCFGVGEHHRADFAVSSPEAVIGVIAGRTRRIRLGSATTVLSSDDPVRVFQRFATLHAATSGRVEVVLGRGWFTESFALFGHDVSRYAALFDEKLELFVMLLRQRAVTWQGEFRPRLTNQSVYPPLEGGPLHTWLAVGATPESVLRAARHDLPMMIAVIGGEPERFRPFVELYRSAFAKLGTAVRPIGVHSPGYIAETDARARAEFWAAYKPLRDRIGAERGWPPLARGTFESEVERGSLYVGSPETVARKILGTVRTLGLSRFDLKYSAGALPHENLLRCIELYGGKVCPLVRDMLGVTQAS